jgi:hypothetical protein
MNWCEFISGVYSNRVLGHGMECKAVFQPPASFQDLAELESQLGAKLPTDLRSLLLQSNGVMSMLKLRDGDWMEDMWLFWTTSNVIEQNHQLRRATMHPFDDTRRSCPRAEELLFFASDGADGIFAHPVNAKGVAEPSVLVWTPIGDELTPIASSLKDFVEGSLTGQTPHY